MKLHATNARPNLPDAARVVLKALVVALVNAGLVTATDAHAVIRLLKLGDA